MKKHLTIRRVKNGDTFRVYPNQNQPQPVHVEMDENGNVHMDYDGEIGNAVPVYVYNGRTRRWSVPFPVNGKTGNHILSDIKPMLKQVLDGLSVEWDGNNNVGRLTDDAWSASEEIREELNSYAQLSDIEHGFCDPEYIEWCENQ